MSVDEYVDAQPVERSEALTRIRKIMVSAAVQGSESIKYGMPAYVLQNGRPIFFASWKRHVSLHAIPRMDEDLEIQLAPYRSGKDTLKFPADSVPIDLIERVVRGVVSQPA